jgi:hypothetical protein
MRSTRALVRAGGAPDASASFAMYIVYRSSNIADYWPAFSADL